MKTAYIRLRIDVFEELAIDYNILRRISIQCNLASAGFCAIAFF